MLKMYCFNSSIQYGTMCNAQPWCGTTHFMLCINSSSSSSSGGDGFIVKEKETATIVSGASANKRHYNKFQIVLMEQREAVDRIDIVYGIWAFVENTVNGNGDESDLDNKTHIASSFLPSTYSFWLSWTIRRSKAQNESSFS